MSITFSLNETYPLETLLFTWWSNQTEVPFKDNCGIPLLRWRTPKQNNPLITIYIKPRKFINLNRMRLTRAILSNSLISCTCDVWPDAMFMVTSLFSSKRCQSNDNICCSHSGTMCIIKHKQRWSTELKVLYKSCMEIATLYDALLMMVLIQLLLCTTSMVQ